ncbi:copper transporter [Marinitenerispora sediminis]|uniref:Copper transporter n=1 Tax=Marinitenerispora sediminis TaxID=1931232 RepID=A0A368T6S1_9ACTN|nr:copper transporter [Marinitenerispora sediminis]RCV54221.1 copper transporter [Marinitenerispora sediminis]RCV59520.1 copper transporter [Marinitenerispora sediminis]RCV59775.1 copper transporter [Marinitenerispora sediminis]
MIDFRYHLVSIVAIFLALTVGIVLGTTMLQDPLLNTLQSETSQLREQSEDLRAEKDVADQINAGDDQLVGAFAGEMLADQLTGARIVVVEAPGVDDELRAGLTSRIEQAGGTVPGRLSLTDKFLDPEQSAFVNELTDQLAEGVELPRGNAYERAGAELAQVLIAPEEDAEDEEPRDAPADGEDAEEREPALDPEAVLGGFAEGGLLTQHGDVAQRADLVLVLAPAEPFAAAAGEQAQGMEDDTAAPGNAAVLALTRAFDAAAGGAVLAGGTSSIEAGGLLAQARAEEAGFTTVDTAGSTSGDVVTVLALAITLQGRSGHYGIGEGVDNYLPDPLPQPTRPNDSPESDEDSGADPDADSE